MARKWLRRAIAACALLVVLIFAAGHLLGAALSPSADPRLTRNALHAPNGYTVSYLAAGPQDAPRIIYVHGTPGSAADLQRYLADPFPGFEAISIDRPGFGQTRPRKAAPELTAQAAAIEPFLVERNGQWPILVGHSLGAPIICQAAIDYPGRVRALVILAGSVDPDLETVYWIQHLGNAAFIPRLLPRWIRHANQETIPLRGELKKLKPLLPEITCPVIIVHSTDDRLVPYGNAEYLLAQLPRDIVIATITLEGKNHFLPWNAEDTVREAIRRSFEATADGAY